MDFLHLREPVSAWSHCAGLLLALPGTLLLWRRSRSGDPAKRLSLLIFGLSLACCYAASTLYHGLRVQGDGLSFFDRLDRIGIFILIAGTYTPLAWVVMSGWWRWSTLAIAWLVTVLASWKLMLVGPFPHLLNTGLYLAMGWGVLACYAELARIVSHRALRPLVAGGVFYSLGAVLNLLGWPVLWPGLFGVHELFHMFVIAGSLAHYRLMLKLVVPFEQRHEKMALGLSRDAILLVEHLPSLSCADPGRTTR